MYDYIITKPELNEDTLAHFGIKGMKWKRHKKRPISRKKNVTDNGKGVKRRNDKRLDIAWSAGSNNGNNSLPNGFKNKYAMWKKYGIIR